MNARGRGARGGNPAQPSTSVSTRSQTSSKKRELEDDLIEASTSAAVKICDSISLVNNEFISICKDASIDQRIEALKTVKELVCSGTAVTAVEVGKIYAENSSKRFEASLAQQQPSILIRDTNLRPTATAYKITFKPKNLNADRPVIKPVDEFYDATGHLQIQILDSYNSANGHVICIQTREMFLEAKTALLSHMILDEKPLTDYFDIHDQIISAYSIKTDNFSKEILVKNKLTTNTSDGLPVLDVKATINFLKRYNKGWFPSDDDIENVEVFNLNRANNDKVSLKVHVSFKTFNTFLAALTTKIMLYDTSVRVFEQIPVTQCMRCCGFGHVTALCLEEKAKCRFCGADERGDGGHRSKDCTRRESATCCNCIAAGKSGDEIKHSATSFACKLLKREADILRKTAKSKKCADYMFN